MLTESQGPEGLAVELDPASIGPVLQLGLLAITASGLIVEALAVILGDTWLLGLYPIISLTYEQSLPLWYLMGLLALSGLLACLLSQAGRQGRRESLFWSSLAVGLALLSLHAFSGFGADLFAAIKSALEPDLIEWALQHHSTWLVGAGTVLVVLLVLCARLGLAVLGHCLTLPAECLIPLTAGVGTLVIAPFLTLWPWPLRLWYALGGHETGDALVSRFLAWLSNSVEIAGASLVCVALASLLARQTGSLVIGVHAPVRPGKPLGRNGGFGTGPLEAGRCEAR